MPPFLPPLIGGCAVVVAVEFALWRLFRRKIEGLRFPRDLDTSVFRVFSVRRLRVLAVLHALLLMGGYGLSLVFVW